MNRSEGREEEVVEYGEGRGSADQSPGSGMKITAQVPLALKRMRK